MVMASANTVVLMLKSAVGARRVRVISRNELLNRKIFGFVVEKVIKDESNKGCMLNLTFEQEMKLYDWIFYSCIAIIVVWLILKMTGVINTPLIVLYLPAIVGVLGLFVSFHKVSKYFGRLNGDISYLKEGVKEGKEERKHLSSQIHKLNKEFHGHLKQFH